jgi:hypothetical protein
MDDCEYVTMSPGDEFYLRDIDREYQYEFMFSRTLLLSVFKKMVQPEETKQLWPRLRVVRSFDAETSYTKSFDAEFIDPFFVVFSNEVVQVKRISACINDIDLVEAYILK